MITWKIVSNTIVVLKNTNRDVKNAQYGQLILEEKWIQWICNAETETDGEWMFLPECDTKYKEEYAQILLNTPAVT